MSDVFALSAIYYSKILNAALYPVLWRRFLQYAKRLSTIITFNSNMLKLIFSVQCWQFLAFLLGVMPLWLSSVEMWDGVIGQYALDLNDWSIIKGWVLDSNWYVSYGLLLLSFSAHELLGLPYWVFFKGWISLMILGVGYEAYRLAVYLFQIEQKIAVWIPALIFSFPIWYVFFSYVPMIGHLTCVWFALLGYRFLQAEKVSTQLLGVLLITTSFQLASNCAFVIALEISRWLMSKEKSTWKCSRSLLIISLSVMVYLATRVVWPPVGTYVGYNKLLNPFDPSSWLTYLQRLAFWSTWLILLAPLSLLFLRASSVGKRLKDSKLTINSIRLNLLSQSNLNLYSFILLAFAAVTPYIAVGLASPLFVVNVLQSNSVSAALASSANLISIWYGGWGARHLLLLMIVMVLFSAWMIRTTKSRTEKNANDFSSHGQYIFLLMISINLACLVPGHAAKLTRIAHEQTIVNLLKRPPMIAKGQVDFLLDKNIDYLVSSYEANYLLYRAYESTHWFAYMMPDHPVVQKWVQDNRNLISAQSRDSRTLLAAQNVMTDYDWSSECKTRYRVALPALTAMDILWRAEHEPHKLPKASMAFISSNC